VDERVCYWADVILSQIRGHRSAGRVRASEVRVLVDVSHRNLRTTYLILRTTATSRPTMVIQDVRISPITQLNFVSIPSKRRSTLLRRLSICSRVPSIWAIRKSVEPAQTPIVGSLTDLTPTTRLSHLRRPWPLFPPLDLQGAGASVRDKLAR